MAEEILSSLEGCRIRLTDYMENLIKYKKTLLTTYEKSCFTGCEHLISSRKKDIENLKNRINYGISSLVEGKKMALVKNIKTLEALSPLSVLARGYAFVSSLDTGEALVSSGQVKRGDVVDVRLSDGSFTAIVEKIDQTHGI
jgi:exonuclease VII large subunit